MDLINEQNGLFPIHAKIILSLFYNCFHIFLARYGCIDLGKTGACSIGNDFCKGSLSGSRRAVKDNRCQLICLNGTIQQFVFSNDVLLSDHLIQCSRTQSGCEGRLLVQSF